MIYVERKTQKNFLSSRWELSPRPSMIYTAISRKVVGKNVHATIPKGNMGYYQFTIPGTVALETTFVTFLWHSQTYIHGLSCHSLKFLWRTVNSNSPTIPYNITKVNRALWLVSQPLPFARGCTLRNWASAVKFRQIQQISSPGGKIHLWNAQMKYDEKMKMKYVLHTNR